MAEGKRAFLITGFHLLCFLLYRLCRICFRSFTAMARVSRGVTNHARHKKVLKLAKGYRGRQKNTIRIATERVEKGLQYAYRDRRQRKRDFRSLWIQRINAGVREYGLTYSRFIDGLNKANVEVDRKVLSDLAIHNPEAFKGLVETAQAALK